MRNLKSALLLGTAVAFATTACTKPAEDAAKPAAGAAATAAAATTAVTVDGTKLSSQLLDTFIQAVTGKPAAEAPKETRDQLLDQLVSMALAAQAGEKQNLQKDPETAARLDLLRMQILAEAASDKYVKANPVTDEEVRKEYDTAVAAMPKEFKARHILVEKKEDAEAIIKQLQAGGDFAKIAKEKSKDPGSAANGGDLGWFGAGTMVKPFSDAVAALQKGQTTPTPVQTEYGFHVIQLEDTRTSEAPAFDDVKDQVKTMAERRKLQAYLDQLRAAAKIQKTT